MPYSHREDFPLPPHAKLCFHQPFSLEAWSASSFAPASRIEWFRAARYGMFIHFGLSTYKNQDLSWGICHTRKPPDCGHGPYPDAEWKRWPGQFKLEKFDAREWVRIAQEAGFRYVVLITKHHDGFHMWDTDQSEFKITNTPFGRDVVKEVVDACHAAGMPVGLYYSQRDWHHPDYMPVDSDKVTLDGNRWSLKPGETSPVGACHARYLAYQEQAVRELCTRYGKIDIFWWDAAWWRNMFTAEMWDGERINRMIRELQPGIVINNRCSIPGDFDTPEGKLGTFQNWRPWESCICLTGTWSHSGTPPKAREQLIRMLTSNACGDGNLLLSWGPHWDGAFDQGEKERLLEVAGWLKTHGRALFNTRGGPWKPGAWGGSTHRGETVYLHLFECASDKLDLPELPGRTLLDARLLDGAAVPFSVADGMVSFALPASGRQESPVRVVELRFDGSVEELEAMATEEESMFHDAVTYGSPLTLSDVDLVSQAGDTPRITMDLKQERWVTGIRLERLLARDSGGEIQILVSGDGVTWEKQESTREASTELALNRYEAGALIPGCPARFLRLESPAADGAVLALQRCDVFVKNG